MAGGAALNAPLGIDCAAEEAEFSVDSRSPVAPGGLGVKLKPPSAPPTPKLSPACTDWVAPDAVVNCTCPFETPKDTAGAPSPGNERMKKPVPLMPIEPTGVVT